MSSNPIPLFFKAHVDTYTRKDGSVVRAHEDSRPAARRPIKKGDRVKIKPEHQDDGDDKYTWHAVDDEDKGRVTVSPTDHPMKVKPTYVMQSHMVEHHGGNKTAGKHDVKLIEGTMSKPGGYSVNGKEFTGDEHEELVDEAKQIATDTGKPITEVLRQIAPKHHFS